MCVILCAVAAVLFSELRHLKQIVALLAAKGRIAAASYRIRLRISFAHWILYTLHWAWGCFPKMPCHWAPFYICCLDLTGVDTPNGDRDRLSSLCKRSASAALNADEPTNWPMNSNWQAARKIAGRATIRLCHASSFVFTMIAESKVFIP